MATVELVGTTFRGQRLETYMPSFDATAPSPYERSQAATSSEQPTSATSPTTNTSSFEDPGQHDFSTISTSHPHGLDATQIAVNFCIGFGAAVSYSPWHLVTRDDDELLDWNGTCSDAV